MAKKINEQDLRNINGGKVVVIVRKKKKPDIHVQPITVVPVCQRKCVKKIVINKVSTFVNDKEIK